MERQRNLPNKTVLNQKAIIENKLLLHHLDLVRSLSFCKKISDLRPTNRKSYRTYTCSSESGTWGYRSRRWEKSSRSDWNRCHHQSLTFFVHKRKHPESNVKVMIVVIKRYQKVVDYCSYCVHHEPHRNNDEMASEFKMIPRMSLFRYNTRNLTEISKVPSLIY